MVLLFMEQSNCGQDLEGVVPELCWCKEDAVSLRKIMYSVVVCYTWAHLSPNCLAAPVEMVLP